VVADREGTDRSPWQPGSRRRRPPDHAYAQPATPATPSSSPTIFLPAVRQTTSSVIIAGGKRIARGLARWIREGAAAPRWRSFPDLAEHPGLGVTIASRAARAAARRAPWVLPKG